MNSNLCDHNPPTSKTDRQTDGQTDGQTDDMRSQDRVPTKVHRVVKMVHVFNKKVLRTGIKMKINHETTNQPFCDIWITKNRLDCGRFVLPGT